MKSVHGRHERKLILLNNLNQPVGPSDAVVAEFGSFLGTLARNASLCPLDILDWRKMDTKEDIWEYTKSKYDIPDSAKRYTLETVRDSWRKHKCKLKEYHFDPYESDETRMQHVPEDVPVCQFKELLRYWNSEKLQRMSKTNIENRKKLKNPHTTGKRSFALVRSKLEKEKTTSDPLLAKEVFVATRKRKVGRSYKSSDEDTTSKIAEMEEIEAQQKENGNESVEAFASVMGPEYHGTRISWTSEVVWTGGYKNFFERESRIF